MYIESEKIITLSGEPHSLAKKPKNRQQQLGQVITPFPIALQMLESLKLSEFGKSKTILDPCFGPGTFYKALCNAGLTMKVKMIAYEIDSEILKSFENQDIETDDSIMITLQDYLLDFANVSYDYAILNPPYVRQEWIQNRKVLKSLFKNNYNVDIPGTSNLYVYFLVKTIMQLKKGGKFSAIVYDSWQATRYGEWLYRFIKSYCTNISIRSLSNLPFDGQLIDATIINGEKRLSGEVIIDDKYSNEFQRHLKLYPFTRNIIGLKSIEELFWTKRGLRLKQASFFMASLHDVPTCGATPFVKKVALIKGYHVSKSHSEAALLLNENNGNQLVNEELNRRIKVAQLDPDKNVPIINWYKQRPNKWLYHGNSPIVPLIFNYYLRKRPKFIHNPCRQYADNFYGLNPYDNIDPKAWLAVLNSTLVAIGILEQARNQGGGLAKLQLFEFRRAQVPCIENWDSKDLNQFSKLGERLIDYPNNAIRIIEDIDALIQSIIRFDDDLVELYNLVDQQARKPKQI